MTRARAKVSISGEAAADRACLQPPCDSLAASRSAGEEPLPQSAFAPHGLAEGIAALAGEPIFAMILAEAGPPRFRRRRNGFGTLLHIILEQQVSIDAAAAMHRRLSEACRPLTPERFLALDEATLRACGFSRQKAGYGRDLAAKVAAGDFDFDEFATADDAGAQAALLALKGIGRWSADVYMLFALGRADIWPAADLGLQLGIAERLGLAARPNEAEVLRLGEAWRPWRSVAACLFWQAYLHKRRRSPPTLTAELYA
jgi:DNA-3-methyladenine glycosylase II